MGKTSWISLSLLIVLSSILILRLNSREVEFYNSPQVFKPKVIEANISAYSSTRDQTDSTPFITASNQKVREGIVANNCLPFGTIVKIADKIFEVQDRMNRRYECHYFDVWVSSKNEAKRFGRQITEVKILN